MIIVLVSSDLMFQSRISSVTRSAGDELVAVRSVAAILERVDPTKPPSSIVFDLTVRGIDLATDVPSIKAAFPGARLIAYGPHVDGDALQMARDSGIDLVMTRGQFDRDMASVLKA
jgi:CheY-like chemotaxis protein